MMIFSHESGFDQYLTSSFYSQDIGWMYQNNFLLEKVFHKGGIKLTILIFLVLIIRYLILIKRKEYKKERIEMLFVTLSFIVTVVLVKLLKNTTTLPCPWHVKIFGGERVFQSFSTIFSSHYKIGHCFPAGHSSAGFAFTSWYFIKKIFGEAKYIHLLPGLLIGVIFGVAQEMRGGHFLSHDLGTLIMAIGVSSLMSYFFYLVLMRNRNA